MIAGKILRWIDLSKDCYNCISDSMIDWDTFENTHEITTEEPMNFEIRFLNENRFWFFENWLLNYYRIINEYVLNVNTATNLWHPVGICMTRNFLTTHFTTNTCQHRATNFRRHIELWLNLLLFNFILFQWICHKRSISNLFENIYYTTRPNSAKITLIELSNRGDRIGMSRSWKISFRTKSE